MTYNTQRLFEIFEEEGQKTATAKRYCAENGIEFNDTIRKRIGEKLSAIKSTQEVIDNDLENESSTNQYLKEDSPSLQMSALRPDGKIMSIKEYCEFYGIPFEQVKSYKLCTYTGKGAYYNLASTTMKGEGFEEFYKTLLQELEDISTRPKTILRTDRPTDKEEYLLVVDPADIHITKLADSYETGEEYNCQIAVKRVREGVEGIIDKVKGFTVDKILFIGGNDILHVDTPKNTTTIGTPQDSDSMWFRGFLMAKQLYIEIIDRLLEVADVHFVYNPSNHDYQSGFFLADVIQTYYKDVKNITFDCDLQHRKYFTYGKNLIGSTHGDGAKTADLPLLMAHESKDWSSCKHKYIYTHHVHHKSSKDYMGVNVESLRSPSGTDGWHSRNGFTHAPKAIEGFLHSKEHGQIARISHIF